MQFNNDNIQKLKDKAKGKGVRINFINYNKNFGGYFSASYAVGSHVDTVTARTFEDLNTFFLCLSKLNEYLKK